MSICLCLVGITISSLMVKMLQISSCSRQKAHTIKYLQSNHCILRKSVTKTMLVVFVLFDQTTAYLYEIRRKTVTASPNTPR